jgi:hypothetical protein
MNPIAPSPATPDIPRCTRPSADEGSPSPAAALRDVGHSPATDRGPDWAALAGLIEYPSWLRHIG